MLTSLTIIVDEDFNLPLYAEPETEELDPEHWRRIREIIVDVLEGERKADGVEAIGDHLIGWKVMMRNALSFVAIVEDVEKPELEGYLKALVRRYFDEVDDVRHPEREGVEDVVVDVIPPWED